MIYKLERTTPKRLFNERLRSGEIRCYKQLPGHLACSNYKDWKVKHIMEASSLKQEAESKARSQYIPFSKDVQIPGKVVQIRGGIKSIQPPCQEEALSNGKHPYTCGQLLPSAAGVKRCHSTLKSGTLYSKTNRLGLWFQ